MPIELKIPLELTQVAAYLESLEEKIVFKLLNRAQYKLNPSVYEPGKSNFSGRAESLLDIRFQMQEKIEAKFGRFSVPEERPFTRKVSNPERVYEYENKPPIFIDDYNVVNITKALKSGYLEFIPKICAPGDDGHHGSTVEHDVYLLQAISERVHFGAFFIAESKYQQEPAQYQKLIEDENHDRLWEKLTRKDVEEAIYARIHKKAYHYQEDVNKEIRYSVDPEMVVKLYQDVIIPLTKKGEILYFMKRRKN